MLWSQCEVISDQGKVAEEESKEQEPARLRGCGEVQRPPKQIDMHVTNTDMGWNYDDKIIHNAQRS